MFRPICLSIMALGVAGCAEGSVSPGTLPQGATSGVYTTADQQTVAACIATAIGSTAQSVDGRFVIASVRNPGLSYSVGPNSRDDVYPTQVAVMGTEGDMDESKSVNGCVVAQANPR